MLYHALCIKGPCGLHFWELWAVTFIEPSSAPYGFTSIVPSLYLSELETTLSPLPTSDNACHFSSVSCIGSDRARRHIISIQLCVERVESLAGVTFLLNMTVIWVYKLHGNSINAVMRDRGPQGVGQFNCPGYSQVNSFFKARFTCNLKWFLFIKKILTFKTMHCNSRKTISP